MNKLTNFVVILNAFQLVLQRVAYFRVRVGSGYDYLGYGSGKGIALSLKPGTRVPSGNRRVVRLSKNYVKMSPIRIFFSHFCVQNLGKTFNFGVILFFKR